MNRIAGTQGATLRWLALAVALIAGVVAGVARGGDGLGDSEAEDSGAAERFLGEDEIREFTAGRTFHYTMLGHSRGEEQHFSDGRVTWRLPEGTCMHGVWYARGEMLCYYYGAFRYGCWNVVENEEGFRHSPLEADGTAGDGPSVYINRISEEPVECAPQQLALHLP